MKSIFNWTEACLRSLVAAGLVAVGSLSFTASADAQYDLPRSLGGNSYNTWDRNDSLNRDFAPLPDDYRQPAPRRDWDDRNYDLGNTNRDSYRDLGGRDSYTRPSRDRFERQPSRSFDDYGPRVGRGNRYDSPYNTDRNYLDDRLSRQRDYRDEQTLPDYRTNRPSYDVPAMPRDRWDNNSNNNGRPNPWSNDYRTQPYPGPTTPSKPLPPTAQEKIARRYGDPKVMNMLRQMSQQSAEALYMEVSQYIDGRHVTPTAYSQRAQAALQQLAIAVEQPEFHNALQIRPDMQQISAFQNGLRQLPAASVQNANDTVNLMRQTGQLAAQTLNINPNVVAIEFIYGSLDTLDQYSMLVPAELSGDARTGLENNFVGIGVEVEITPNGLKIIKPIAGGPAAMATLQRGDVITAVNGQRLAGMTMDQAVALIAGPAGSQVGLELQRGTAIGDVSLTRQQVIVRSVAEVRMLDAQRQVGYIKLDKFAESTTQEMDAALWDLHRQGMQSLVLDVRGNPGGLLTTAIEISDRFLPQGTIVSTRGRNQMDNSMEQAQKAQTWAVPLVVLIDNHSASASEILAAAIQENGRGLIVGDNSYGKGTVQTLFPLRSVSAALRLTTAKFYSPNGREMAGVGVKPDVYVSGLNEDDADQRALQAALSATQDPRLQQMSSQTNRVGDATKVLTIRET